MTDRLPEYVFSDGGEEIDAERHIPEAIGSFSPQYIDHGKGAMVYDSSGNAFIDLSGGWGCLAIGYSHPKVVNAVKNQADKFFHTDFSAIPYKSYPVLASKLARLAPGNTPKKTTFFNCGAEAVENAVKFAKVQTGRGAIVCFENAFHGRTLLTMTLTHKAIPYKQGFGPFAPDVYRLPYPKSYRSDLEVDQLETELKNMVDPTSVAAIIVEPVMGEGGFIVPPDDFLPYLRGLADKYGIALIFDEIQCGVGRTGKFFAAEHFGVEADLITLAKSMAGGLPLSAVIGKKEIMDQPMPGSIGGTFVGNPVAIESSLAVLEVIEEENLLQRAEKVGEILMNRFTQMKDKYEVVGDVRGLGAMVALELVKDRDTKEPASDFTSEVVSKAMEKGVLVPTAGLYGNVIRILTPLVIEFENLKKALDLLEESIQEVLEEG